MTRAENYAELLSGSRTLRDERIAALQRVFNLAERFANEAFLQDTKEGY